MTDSPALSELATKFDIDSTRPFFPVNTMRLFYLILADGLTGSNPEAIDKVKKIIPLISGLFSARDEFLSDSQDSTPLEEVQATSGNLTDILTLTNTPVVHHTFDLLFSDLYPLQENLLLALDRHLGEETLGPTDLTSILKIRAMDAVVYSTVIHQTILPHLTSPRQESIAYTPTAIHWQVNLTLQLNDLADAIIHAKDDLEADSATLINIAKKIIKSPDELDDLINSVIDHIRARSAKLPFPQPLQGTVKAYHQAIIDRILRP